MQYIRLSDAVSELSTLRRDDDREEFLRYMIAGKTVLKDLKVVYIPDFKRVFIPINAATMTARLPFDYMRFRTISAMQKCKDKYGNDTLKPIPLTYNPYVNITPIPTKNACEVCGCEPTHPVCVELDSYTTLCEEVVLDYNTDPPTTGTKQTVLKTCENGDIISEVTQPTLKFIKGTEVCDYDIEIEVLRSLCDYDLSFTLTVTVSFRFIASFTLNGENIESGELTSYGAIQTFFEGYGWTAVTNKHYTLSSTTDVYSDVVTFTDFHSPPDEQEFSTTRQCVETNTITFPYTVVSMVINNITVTESPAVEITNQDEQDDFFNDLEFTKIDNTHYKLEGSSDVYYSMLIEDGSSSPAIETELQFRQGNCVTPMISDGISNSITRDVLCNVEIKDCGCIVENAANIETIVSCCGSLLNCCQVGELNNWSGWGYVPSCCPTNTPQPYNPKGTYNIDQKNFIIYFDSVGAQGLLLAYDTDGSCEGDYVFPDYMMKAFKAGIAYEHALYDESVSESRRRELGRNYEDQKTKMDKIYIDPIRMSDLVGALKTPLTPY